MSTFDHHLLQPLERPHPNEPKWGFLALLAEEIRATRSTAGRWDLKVQTRLESRVGAL